MRPRLAEEARRRSQPGVAPRKDWTSMRSLCVKALVHACGETLRDLSTSLHRRLSESGSSEKLDKDRINLAFSFSSANVYSLLRLFPILPSLMSNAKAE